MTASRTDVDDVTDPLAGSHAVMLRLDDEEWERLQRLSQIFGIRPQSVLRMLLRRADSIEGFPGVYDEDGNVRATGLTRRVVERG